MLKLIVGALRLLPYRAALSLAAGLGWLVGAVCPVRRRAIHRNLDIAFGDSLEPATRRRLIRATHSHWFRMAVEFFQLPHIRKRFDEIAPETDGGEIIAANCSPDGQAAIIISAHLGNWELMPLYGGVRHNLPMTAIAKPIHNRRINEWVNALRLSVGVKMLSSREGAKGIRAALRGGDTMGFVADQDAGRRGEFISFFGQPASTYIGPALIARLMNVPIIPGFAVRTGFHRFKIIFYPPLEAPADAATPEDAAIAMMSQYNAHLENLIRQYPEQYFWFHNRWKSRPGEVVRRKGRQPDSAAQARPT